MAIVGIDLGTTNSLVSVWKDGEAVLIPNSDGKFLTPSVVSIDENGEVLIGEAAKERRLSFPENTASCFKRNMGRPFCYSLGGKSFTPTELSSLVLSSLKHDAEKFLGEKVEEAVISVPAYFNQNQRKATKDAAIMAGFKVERLVSEPTAAALRYGIQNMKDMSTVIVLDLGGGTFDVSLLELFDGVIDVKAVSGDNFLGGEDWTQAVAAWFLNANHIEEISGTDKSRLIKAAEIAKRFVSDPEKFSVPYEMNVEIGGNAYKSVLTWEIFNQVTADLQNRIMKPIKRVLQDAEIGIEEIDSVILMGGATRMKSVRDFVTSHFGSYVISSYNPDETVALGAGILAAMKEGHNELKETVLTDICPFTLGTSVNADHSATGLGFMQVKYDPIIERNSPVPISVVKNYCTSFKGQEVVAIDVYQGENFNPELNLKLGILEVRVPKNLKERELINVRFTYDINGLLEVEVEVLSTNEKKMIVINQGGQDLTEEEIKAAQEKMKAYKIIPWEEQENKLLLERGERLFSESVGQVRENISQALQGFGEALKRQNPKEIKNYARKLKEYFDNLEAW